MPFLTLGGMTVQVVYDGTDREYVEIGDRGRASDGAMRTTVRARKRTWRCRTMPLSATDAQQLEGIVTRTANLVASPKMDADSNADGVVNDFSSDVDAGITAIFSVDDSAQKIQITASTIENDASVIQNITPDLEPGDVVSVSVDMRFAGLSNAVGDVLGIWADAVGATVGSFSLTETGGSWQRREIENQVAPGGTDHLVLALRVRTTAVGGTGSGWFRNAQVERASSHGSFTDNSLPVVVFGDFIKGGGANVHPEMHRWIPAPISRAVLEFTLHEV